MPLTSPTLAHPYSTTTSIRLTWGAASGGTGPYVYDVHRSLVSGFTPAAATLLAANQTSPYDDADAALAAQRTYFYKLVTTDAALATVNSAQVSGALEYSPGAAVGMSLTAARAWITQFLRSGASASQYDTSDKDRGLILVCERFARATRCIQVAATVAVAAGNATVDVSGLTLFATEQIMSAHLLTVAKELQLPDYNHVHKLQIECPRSGRPEMLAFESSAASEGIVWPTPDVDYSLRIKWWQTFTVFTPGTASDSIITFNLPDRFLPNILTYGVPAAIQHNHPSMGYASESWKKYLEYEASMSGAGSTGAQALTRDRVR